MYANKSATGVRFLVIALVVMTALTALYAALPAKRVWACSCAGPYQADRLAAGADAVFTGEVSATLDRQPIPFLHRWTGPQEAHTEVTIRVDRVWKGEVGRETVVLDDWSSCAIDFKQGLSYLVYANETESGDLRTIICSGTKFVSAAADDLAVLGKGQPPLTRSAKAARNSSHTTAGGAAAMAFAGAVVLVVLVAVVRFLRRGGR